MPTVEGAAKTQGPGKGGGRTEDTAHQVVAETARAEEHDAGPQPS
jgi:hypothetical protein